MMPEMNLFKRTLSRLAHYANGVPYRQDLAERYHLWSIGIYTGPSPLALAPAPGITNPVLTRDDVMDACALMIADPFMLKVADIWYMFFELYNRRSHGEIGCATSSDGLRWAYHSIVLAEPFHLSYPYVFEWEAEYYMIPESVHAAEVRLYRARRFPDQWEFVGPLLKDHAYADSSIARYNDRWWMWTESSQGRSDTLRLYSTTDLLKPWQEHPRSPIVEWDPERARPAGRIVVVGGQLVRFAQVCFPTYGTEVRAFEITELSPTAYQERAVGPDGIVKPSGSGWNKFGMHHLDAHCLDNGHWIACVDGWTQVSSLLDNLHRRN